MSSDSWPQYAEYAQRLDAVRAEELARTAGMRASVAQMSTHADELQARLSGQNGALLALAGKLKVRRPDLTPIEPEGFVDPAPDLTRVAAAHDRADHEARLAADRGEHATLLPGLSMLARSLVVYGALALVVLALQALAFAQSGTKASGLAVLFIYPLVGFAVGFLVLQIGSRVRIVRPVEQPGRLRPGQKPPRPDGPRTRLGLLLCFGIGPVSIVVYLLAHLHQK